MHETKIKWSLKTKLLALFLVPATLSIYFFSAQFINLIETAQREELEHKTKTYSHLAIQGINNWIISNEAVLLRIGDYNSFLSSAFTKYSNHKTKENEGMIRLILDQNLFHVASFLELFILDKDTGEIIFSSNTRLEGGHANTEEQKLFDKKLQSHHSPFYFSTDIGDYVMSFMTPLKNESGKIMAFIGLKTNIHSLLETLRSSIANTGEIYLLTPQGKVILQDENLNNGRPTQKVMSYREYLPDMAAYVVYENDLNALRDARNSLVQKIWKMAAFIFSISALLVLILVERSMKPVKSLTSTAQKIAEGNYKLRSEARSNDEIGILSDTFNRMTDTLVSSLNEISLKNALLQSQYDASVYGILAIGNKGEIKSWNKSFPKIWNVTHGVLRKKTFSQIFQMLLPQIKDPQNFSKQIGTLNQHHKKAGSHQVELKNGQVIDVQSAPLLDRNKKILGRVFNFSDITKEAEISKVKNEFISLASHQLQTPLTAVKWSLESLLKKAGNEEERKLIQDAYHSTERMIHLVHDLLNVSRIDAGVVKMNPKSVDLFEFVRSLIQEVKITANKKNISIDLKQPEKKMEIILDHTLMANVILNLLSNAIRYSDANKKVSVEIREVKNGAEISVKDQGIGISKKDQSELFSKFFRSFNASKYYTNGSGLGLYLVKKILDVCKGRITIKSALGKGSTFKIFLPKVAPATQNEHLKDLIRQRIS